MAFRVLALTLAAGLVLSSAAVAKEHCPVGQVYFRSRHICVAKGTPVARKIYHYRPPAAKAYEAAVRKRTPPDKTAAVRRQTRPREAALPERVPLPPPRVTLTANSAAEIPLPPPRPMRSGPPASPARAEAEAATGGAHAPAAPEATHRAVSPYGALVPVNPGE